MKIFLNLCEITSFLCLCWQLAATLVFCFQPFYTSMGDDVLEVHRHDILLYTVCGNFTKFTT